MKIIFHFERKYNFSSSVAASKTEYVPLLRGEGKNSRRRRGRSVQGPFSLVYFALFQGPSFSTP